MMINEVWGILEIQRRGTSHKPRGSEKMPREDDVLSFKELSRGFPGGAVVKNPPANAGDRGSSPGPGVSHMTRSNEARVPQLLKPARLEPMLRNKRSHHNEKPPHHNEE